MTERQSGLRFDIYERIHLAESTVGIKALDEVELVPHIQVFTEDEHAILKGNLYVTGQYVGETDDESRTLEHFIPVEITLPLNRVHDLNEVQVAIDNFDVDLLSSRSLNVTGVLTLQGIEMLSVSEDAWQEEEETVFVHEVARLQESAEQQEAEITVHDEEHARDAAELYVNRPSYDQPRVQPSAEVEDEAEEAQEPLEDVEVIAEPEEADELQEVFAELPPESGTAVNEAQTDFAEEKNEVKIGFGSKASSDEAYSLKSFFHKGDLRAAQNPPEEVPAANDEASRDNRLDALEWKRLFSRSEEEEGSFSRIRMVIVQKEDSIDSIAGRYKVNPREILLHNRLAEQDLAEGKVLYIPG